MKIANLLEVLEQYAPTALQASYDNAGLITGSRGWECTGVLCTLDATEEIVEEAMQKGCNLIVAHHPIIFKGLKSITGKNYVERTLIKAIKHDIAIYAIHTNLDHVANGVSGKMADRLGLVQTNILEPLKGALRQLYFYVPPPYLEQVKQAVFQAGAGQIGNYSECSFVNEGVGTFKPEDKAQPFSGNKGELFSDRELKVEVVVPAALESSVLAALQQAHPYETVAYGVVALENDHPDWGSGMIGQLPEALTRQDFLSLLKEKFNLKNIRHTIGSGDLIKTVALCGGAGSFLISNALAAKADAFVTADLKYHEFFDAENKLLLCDIGHFESEQFTIELLSDILLKKFPTFAVLKSDNQTNPIHYF